MSPYGSCNIRKSIPPQLSHLITYLKKPKYRGCQSRCYELHTGYEQVDGYYANQGEAMSALISENLLLILLKEQP